MAEGVVGSAEVVILPDTRQFAAALSQKLGPAFAGVETSVVSVTKAIGGGTRALEIANKAASGVGTSIEQAGKSAAKTVVATENLSKELGNAAKATDAVDAGMVRVGADAAKASDSVGRMGKNIHEAGRATNTLGTLSAVAGTAVAAAVSGTAFSLGRVGVEYNTLLQKTRAAFTTLLGTKEAAQDMIAELTEFARSSPFPRQAFIQGTQQLLGFGVEAAKVIPIFEAVQDAVAAVGGGEQDIAQFTNIFAAIQADGQASLMQLQRFSSQGIDAVKLLAEQAGVSYEAMVKTIRSGNLDAASTIDLLSQALSNKFGGAAAGVKETWLGAVDRVKGAWRDMGSALLAPFIDPNGGGAAVKWANDLANVLRRVQKQYIEPLAAKIKVMMEAFTTAHPFDIDKLFAKVEPVLDMIKQFAPLLSAAGGGLVALLAPMIPVIGEFLPALNPVFMAIAGLILATPELREALLPLLKTFGDIMKLIGTAFTPLLNSLAKAFVPVIEKVLKIASVFIEKLIPVFDKLMVALTPIIDAVGVALMEVLKEIEPLIPELVTAFSGLVDAFVELLPSLIPLIGPLTQLITLALKFTLKLSTEQIKAFTEVIKFLTPAIKELLGYLALGLGTTADLLGGKETQNTKDFANGLDRVSESFKNLGNQDEGGFWDSFKGGISEMGRELGENTDALEEWGQRAAKELGQVAEKGEEALGEIPGYFGGLTEKLEEWTGEIPGYLGGATEKLEEWSGEVPGYLGGATEKLEGLGGEVAGWLGGATENVEDFVGKIPEKLGGFIEEIEKLPGKVKEKIAETIKETVAMPFKIAEGLATAGVWIWDHGLKPAWEFVRDKVPPALGEIVDQVEELPGRIGEGLKNMGTAIWEPFNAAKDWVTENIPGMLGGFVDELENLPGLAKDAIWGIGTAIWDAFEAAGSWVSENIPGWLGGFVEQVEKLPGLLKDAVWGIGGKIWDGFIAAKDWIVENIPGFLGGIVDEIERLPGMIWDAIVSGVEGLGSIAKSIGNFFVDFLNDSVIKPINEGIPDSFFGFPLPANPIGYLPRLHSGGFIPGAGEFPAILQGGEAVLNRQAAGDLGPAGVAALNAGGTSGTTVKQDITVVGVSWEEAMAKIRFQQEAAVRSVLVS